MMQGVLRESEDLIENSLTHAFVVILTTKKAQWVFLCVGLSEGLHIYLVRKTDQVRGT